MKKVLALVLAVIMVCTMAFALTPVTATDATELGTSGIATLKEANASETYGVEINQSYYVNAAGVDKNVFTASNVTLAKDNGKMYVVVPTLDKALDGVADFTFTGTLKVADKENAGTYVVYGIKNGVLVAIEGKDKGITMSAADLDKKNNGLSSMLREKYDIGFETYVLASDADLEAAITNLTPDGKYDTWYITGSKALSATINDVTVKVPAKTAFKMKKPAAAKTTDLAAAGLLETYTGFDGLFVEGTGITMSLNVTPANNTMNLYAVDKNGKIYSLGTSLTESKKVDGTIVGTLSATFGGTYQIVKLNKAVDVNGTVPGVASAPATPGTTTNPGTGANDVVGVAAALAVVALVSGAAISLKK